MRESENRVVDFFSGTTAQVDESHSQKMFELQVSRRSFLKRALVGGAVLAFGGLDALLGYSEAHAQISIKDIDLPPSARRYVNERFYHKTKEIGKLIEEYAILERRNVSTGNIWWVAVKRKMQGALYIEAGELGDDPKLGQDKEWTKIFGDAVLGIKKLIPRELINDIDRDVTLSLEGKEKVKSDYAAEMFRQFALKPAMAKDKKNLPEMSRVQQIRMAHPQKEDNFGGLVGLYDIDPEYIDQQIIRLHTKKDYKGIITLGYIFPSSYPEYDFLLKNAEAMEIVSAIQANKSVLAKPNDSMLVTAREQVPDPSKGIAEGLCPAYLQFNPGDPELMLDFAEGKGEQLKDLIWDVQIDRSRRASILEPIDPNDHSPLRAGERESDRMRYVKKGRLDTTTYRRKYEGDNSPDRIYDLKKDPNFEKRVNDAMNTNLGPKMYQKPRSQLSQG